MIITGAWTALFAVLAGLGIADPWTAIAAIVYALLLAFAATDPYAREMGWRLDGLLLESLHLRRGHRDSDLPGPGQPQASGVTSDDDTTISGWTPEQMAFIRGETDEPPGMSTLPDPTDIPDERPS